MEKKSFCSGRWTGYKFDADWIILKRQRIKKIFFQIVFVGGVYFSKVRQPWPMFDLLLLVLQNIWLLLGHRVEQFSASFMFSHFSAKIDKSTQDKGFFINCVDRIMALLYTPSMNSPFPQVTFWGWDYSLVTQGWFWPFLYHDPTPL